MVEKFKSKILKSCFALTVVPLGNPADWKELKFSSLPANKVTYEKSALKIEVDGSASPLVFGFGSIKNIEEISADIEITGLMNQSVLEKSKDFEEDSYLRIGLIVEGKNIPSRFKMMFAPEWVRLLFSFAPQGVGLDKIYFHNMTTQKKFLGKKRSHPKSDLIHEENIILFLPEQKKYQVSHMFSPVLKAAGLWISVDGDDTKSKFTVMVQNLKYKVSPAEEEKGFEK